MDDEYVCGWKEDISILTTDSCGLGNWQEVIGYLKLTFFLLMKFLQKEKFKTLKWSDFGGFSLLEVRKNSKNC